MKHKLIMENWRKFNENSSMDDDWSRVADEIYQDRSGQPAASDIEREILWHAGKQGLDVPGELVPAAKAAGIKQIDDDFLVAWVTGRLAGLGGPSPTQASAQFGNLFEKYKNFPTKYDSNPQDRSPANQDPPSDGHEPIDQSAYDTHSGGVEQQQEPSKTRPTHEHALSSLRALIKMDLANLTPTMAEKVKSIILTCVDSLENEEIPQ